MATDREMPLGREVVMPQAYDPGQLLGIERAPARCELGMAGELPFCGEDIWNCWEFGWLDESGRPQTAVLELRVPADSPAMFESKSCKLYLYSWLNHRAAPESVADTIAADLSAVAGAPVSVQLSSLELVGGNSPVGGVLTPQAQHPEAGLKPRLQPVSPVGASLDGLRVEVPDSGPDPAGLRGSAAPGRLMTLCSDLFVSLCPVTGQPDWATVRIELAGVDVHRPSLLRYLLSYRRHQAFHESCCEKIWQELWQQFEPESLTVEMRFLRRGGIDINPVRSSGPSRPLNQRLVRQ